jgi:hypothetical protein
MGREGMIQTPYVIKPSLYNTVVASLAFSVAFDVLTTGMIAGRLFYYHRRGAKHSSSYLPLVTIFIESAVLSTISKILQISVTSPVINWNPLVIPLCVSFKSLASRGEV